MRDQTLRGSRLGGRSLASDDGVELSDRKRVSYTCPSCAGITSVVFAAEAEEPEIWTCSSCGQDAGHEGKVAPQAREGDEDKIGRTPFDMLLERRTREELEVILEERLQYLRSRRGEEQLGA